MTVSEKEVVEEYRRFSGTALDMQRLRRRIEAVERRIGLQETQSGIDGRCLEALQDRVASLEKRPAISTEVIEALANRVAAVEREIAETELRRAKLGSQVFGLRGRLDALESRQQGEAGEARNKCWIECGCDDEAGEADPCLAAGRHVCGPVEDEAGEGAEPSGPTEWKQWSMGYQAGECEMAREIVERLRGGSCLPIGGQDSAADWIESEFGGK